MALSFYPNFAARLVSETSSCHRHGVGFCRYRGFDWKEDANTQHPVGKLQVQRATDLAVSCRIFSGYLSLCMRPRCTVPIQEMEPSNLFCVLVMKSGEATVSSHFMIHFMIYFPLFLRGWMTKPRRIRTALPFGASAATPTGRVADHQWCMVSYHSHPQILWGILGIFLGCSETTWTWTFQSFNFSS